MQQTMRMTGIDYKNLDQFFFWLSLSQDKEQIINTKKNVISCFNTIKLNVIDTVPRCIQYFFVIQLVESLTKELESTDLMEFLQEKEDVRRARDKSQRTLDSIEHNLPQAEKITLMLLRIKQGRPAFTR